MSYNPSAIESKWQNYWSKNNIFKFQENSDKEKYYVLEMFPFPSGKIHMGHLRNYAIGDVISRFKKAQGFNVLHPIGFDAFGLPAENAALSNNTHPKEWTHDNIANMTKEIKSIGFSYDWSRSFNTCDVEYYKHEQKIFIDFFKNNLAYQKESYVNWDPVDQTVLANEQVINGCGWRSGALVEKKKLKQWFLRVSQFSEELLSELKNLKGWDERVLSMQKKWIGKSQGALIDFTCIENKQKIQVYTTRPETIYGASFIGISANHPLALQLAQENNQIANFIEKCNKSGAVDEATLATQEKLGINTQLTVNHPLIKDKKLPIYIANFILMDYGTGAIFACPAHDQRDFEFAKKYNLPITQVVSKNGQDEDLQEAFTQKDGIMINSPLINGLKTNDAFEKICQILSDQKIGKSQTNYRLKDWGISRQRYWGCPIPMLYLKDGSVVPVPQDQLPVTLPDDVTFDGNGNPLAQHKTWKKTTYKGQPAIRETDSFDTFFESSWYFLRFASNPADKAFDFDTVNKILPVDDYIGGIEHAVLHLLYARFFTKALKKCGYLNFNEPFKNLTTQGMVCHKTYKDSQNNWVMPSDVIKENNLLIDKNSKLTVTEGRSEKMSKSKKNVIEPFKIIEKYGADTARLFMLSDSPITRDLEWSDSALEGCFKYLKKIYLYVENFTKNNSITDFKTLNKQFSDENNINQLDENNAKFIKLTHKLIANFTKDIQEKNFNRAIARLREFSNEYDKFQSTNIQITNFTLNILVNLISLFTPHLGEELWQKLGHTNSVSNYLVKANETLTIDDEIKIAIQVNGKLRAILQVNADIDKQQLEKKALENEIVKKNIANKQIKKVIFVPKKLINIVAI